MKVGKAACGGRTLMCVSKTYLGPCHHPGIIRGGYEQRIDPNRADQSREQHEQYGSISQKDRPIVAVEPARCGRAHPKGKRRRHDVLQFVRRARRGHFSERVANLVGLNTHL
jgi:hypothetical protein